MLPALSRLTTSRIVAIIRVPRTDGVAAACRVLVENGIDSVEITQTVPGAVSLIADLTAEFGGDLTVGAGTVMDLETCRAAVDAGAEFVVSPVFDPEIVQWCRTQEVVAIPGALTPTEIVRAWREGADVVKLFPARVATPSYLADLFAPLPDLRLMPTGGIDEDGARAYLNRGAAAVGVGGRLADPTAIAAGDLRPIASAAQRFHQIAIDSGDSR
jgi:2-dehydro-3-deoxyphosphogluconate aldolase/(4S)-4-hydroxy-2-oxoglutarate aldolase